MPIELGSFDVIIGIGDETLTIQSNRTDKYASIVASEQRAGLFGRIGTLERDNMRLRGMLGVERQRVDRIRRSHAIWFDQRTRGIHGSHESGVAPILALPDGTENFVVYYNAWHNGLGTIMMQKEKIQYHLVKANVAADALSRKERAKPLKVSWNSRRGLEFTWEHEDQFQKKYPYPFAKSVTASNVMS
ncbi:hypothetical protein Tco_1324934 [Tanacetum coccineum]